jgi:hypothetical protein
MSKRLILVLALAFVIGIAVCAYAEVQNVKVSGDILLRGISRSNFSLNKSAYTYTDEGAYTWVEGDDGYYYYVYDPELEYTVTIPRKYKVSGLTSTARVRVDADLTDNVSTTVRLLNERSWGLEDVMDEGGTADVSIDLAYVTLKEFLYSPLTLTLGRQELRFGNALIIGDPDTNLLADEYWVPSDLSARKAFDAMRATLNYDPLVIDLIYAKIDEDNWAWWDTNGVEKNDTDLYGMNAAYNLKDLGITGKAELYFFSRVTRWPVYSSGLTKKDICNTIGTLVSGRIVDNLSGSLEYAYQFGNAAYDWEGINDGVNLRRRAFALQAVLNYAFQTKYNPNLTLAYTYLSGDKKDDNKYKYWDPMFEDQAGNNIVEALFPNSNNQSINVMGSIKPKEDLTLSANYGYYRLAQSVSYIYGPYASSMPYIMTDKKTLGSALDITATYDYTEDVQLGLTFGYFNPGNAFDKSYGYKQNATQLIGSMKVTF